MSRDKKPQKYSKGNLYMVATPLGNLEDITLRALRILKEVALIAAEDTRRTRKLLTSYGIATPLTSLYDHNEATKSASLVNKMLEGMDIAYVSDAGTPGISDPGYLLVRESLAGGINVIPIPGACAAIAALSVSGMPSDIFVFHGFLPARSGKRREVLRSLLGEKKTMIFYESPKRLAGTLGDMTEILGSRSVAVARELTKIHEEIIRGSLEEVARKCRLTVARGEITIILSGGDRAVEASTLEDLHLLLLRLKGETGLSDRDLVDRISVELNMPRKIVYREVIRSKSR